ncbi:MAG: DUF5519 family protein [Chitinophagaceae bacterium]
MNLLLNHIKHLRFLSVIAIIGKKVKYIPFLPVILDEIIKSFTFLFYPNKFVAMKALITRTIKETNAETIYHRFGGIEFHCDKKEIAHLHSNGLLDINFPKRITTTLIKQKWCSPHHIHPDTGWISFYIKSDKDLNKGIQLIKWSKEIKTGMKMMDCLEKEMNHSKDVI